MLRISQYITKNILSISNQEILKISKQFLPL